MSTLKPWTRVRRGDALDFTILRVREDRVRHPVDGSEHPRVIIEAPDWVNIIATTREDELVLVRQFRMGVWAPTLELPGGIVDPGEDPRAAALRELEEETGFRAPGCESLGWIHPNPAIQTNRAHSYLARDCQRVHAGDPDEGEDLEVVLVPRARIPELVAKNEITHSLVIAALYLETLKQPR
jgi:ADP-ribose pyrophosphatase